jgi:hypothetical protein
MGTHQPSASVSWSEHRVQAIKPEVMSRFRRGGKRNGMVVDALVVESGAPHALVSFNQIFPKES